MKVVILAGGFGTRISEESHLRPKPMIEIGGKPILWHIMKLYAHYGYREFVVCLGYKGYKVKEYFQHYFLYHSDVTFDFGRGGSAVIHQHTAEPWTVTLVDTGADTMTGGRLKRVAAYLGGGPFMLTYGDGVSNLDLRALEHFHRSHGKLATVTAVQPGGRFGALRIEGGGAVRGFVEKPRGDGHWVNGGFFVMEPGVLDRIAGDASILEKDVMEALVREGELRAFKHEGFWQAMDTLRDKNLLEAWWASGDPPWKVWPS